MALLIDRFEGLTEPDFDVYRPECWANNMHNLARMRTKERVLGIAKQVQAVVDDAGLVLEASAEVPSVWNGRKVCDQWAYLFRGPAARKALAPVFRRDLTLAARVRDPAEHHRHVLLAVRLDHEVVEIGLRVNEHATVDLANVLGRGRADRAGLEAALADLPEGVTLGDDEGPVTPDALLAGAHAARKGQAEWLRVGRRIPQAEAIAMGADLAGAAVEVARALRPLLDYIAWTAENDHVGVGEVIDEFAQELAEHQAERDKLAQQAAEERDARSEAARARTEAKLAAEDAWRALQRKVARSNVGEVAESDEGAKPARRGRKAAAAGPGLTVITPDTPLGPLAADGTVKAPPAEPTAAPAQTRTKPVAPKKPRAPKKPKAEPKPRAVAAAAPKAPAPPVDLQVGDKVRLTRGLLAGKEGEIREAAKKGYYKVRIGVLEMPVAAQDLEPMV